MNLERRQGDSIARSILFVTGTRADFGKLEPLALAARDAGFRVGFFVTGMHMLERYGLTKLEVTRIQGVTIHEFLNQRPGDPQDIVLAKTVMGFSDFVTEHCPDLIVVHGDRVEALACAMVSATNYIRSAHIEGGEVSGTIDEIFRHCNSKLCTHHFVSSQNAARRVMALGEPKEAIHVVGSPELDFHSGPSGVSIATVRQHYDIPEGEYGICTFHPVTSEVDTIGQQVRALFETLTASNRHFVVIAPNNDPGSEDIFAVFDTLPKDRFRILPSMRFAHFSELMKNASCIIGNSSAGVREAPFLGIPSLDIGTRQTARGNAPSLFSASADDSSAIEAFLQQQWGKRYENHEGFGAGSAADAFIDVLGREDFWNASMQKRFHEA